MMPDEAMESYDGLSDRAGSPSMHMDHEKRMRREIANSNERRRMQSINAGFQSLRTLLPHHEGEKLSKAAILQQTAEYIYTLEQEKTRLLSQNCQLKRIINQHEGETSTAVKKRKTDSGPVTVVPAPVSESSDEGIGSMSPEPVSMGASGGTTVPTPEQENATEMLRREMMDLRVHLERERRIRLVLEDQVKSLENQLFPDRAPLQYQHEVAAWPEDPPLEEDLYPDLKQDAELSHSIIHQTVVEREIPPRRESQCSSHSGSRLFKDEVDGVTSIQSSAIVASPSLIFAADTEGPQMASLPIPVVASPCPSPIQTTILGPVSPVLEPAQPSVLEAAIKAEPKVEVERLPSPPSISDDQARLFINTSRQNLETIVEAIRHLEGDHLFSDDPSPHRLPVLPPQSVVTSVTTEVIVPHQDHLQERLQGCPENEAQEMPLALTTNSRVLPQQSADQRILKMKMDSFTYQQQQHRPGVIVVKHT